MRHAVLSSLILASVATPAVAQEKGAPPATPAQIVAARATTPTTTKKKVEPRATAEFPGFDMIKEGGSRIYVDLSKRVQVDEQLATGTITYVFKDARVDSYNDTNPLELFYFDTPAVRARMHVVKKDVVLTVVLRADVKATTRMVDTPQGARFEIDFPAGSYAEKSAPPMPKVEKKKKK